MVMVGDCASRQVKICECRLVRFGKGLPKVEVAEGGRVVSFGGSWLNARESHRNVLVVVGGINVVNASRKDWGSCLSWPGKKKPRQGCRT